MKKSLLALAVLGAFAGVAQAQSQVTIYGALDLAVSKTTGSTTSMVNGDNNKLGFKGSEDLGGGLSATFQAEIRMDSDTGNTEGGGTRPLFQGQTRVGLAGAFGQVRLGRGLTAVQDADGAYDPWGATRNRGTFVPTIMDAGYGSDPLNPANGSQNRFSNALFYNSPVMGGFQGNVTVATKETGTLAVGGVPFGATNVPYSLAGTYNNGPISAMLGYERNAVGDKYAQIAGSYNVGVANLMASYAQTKFGTTGLSFDHANAFTPATATTGASGIAVAPNAKTKAWLVGANIVAGPGNVLVGYGQKKGDSGLVQAGTIKQASLGYEYKLSKRTFVYTDYVNARQSGTQTKNTIDVGIHHNF
ncbi:porin [Undibacterium arcticum]|uniref:Porin n=1 Tax=Undibacterium arcticum TaxID=1762892 RepID=A0ABV7EYJ9_9BURK